MARLVLTVTLAITASLCGLGAVRAAEPEVSQNPSHPVPDGKATLLDPSPGDPSAPPSLIDAALFLLQGRESVPRAGDRYVTVVRKHQYGGVGNEVIYWTRSSTCTVRETQIETNVDMPGRWRPSRLLGMGNHASIREYDLTKIGDKGRTDTFREPNTFASVLGLAFNKQPGFCMTLMPKDYTSPDVAGYQAWGKEYGPIPMLKPEKHTSFYFGFYTDYFFGNRSLVPNGWYADTDEKLRPYYLKQYQQKLRQNIGQIADSLDKAQYTRSPCKYPSHGLMPDISSDQIVYYLNTSKGLKRGEKALARFARAREYIGSKFACNYTVGARIKKY